MSKSTSYRLPGGHFSHPQFDTFKGIYRSISKDGGKTWSPYKPMPQMTKLLSGKPNTIGKYHAPICNALKVPNMTWKGKKGTALLIGFYIHPVKFLISMDGGRTWDMFYDAADYKDLGSAINEMSWDLLDNRTIYVVSRRQSKSGYKNELFFNLDGSKPEYVGQDNKNHLARRCHHGSFKIPEGKYKGRVALVSHYKSDREDATIAISTDPTCRKFDKPRYLTFDAGWGYCDITYNETNKSLVVVGESEPFDPVTEKVIPIDHGPDRNERFTTQCFQFSLDFYESLVEVPKL